MSKIINGDCLEELKKLEDNSIDSIVTDPPYGYSFMGKDWDKAVPSVDVWKECLRVLKPGGWCMVMSAPRSDVQNAMISRLMEAGFRLDFTPIYWTYASGFPKAGNIGKMIDKRLGVQRKRISVPEAAKDSPDYGKYSGSIPDNNPITAEAQQLNGSYAGFQPKPAVEVVIVAMKPLSEKTYVDQALKNGKGITWLDDCRVPTDEKPQSVKAHYSERVTTITNNQTPEYNPDSRGRFPANLLVSDNTLGDYSKFFDLDKWADTLPFLAVPKASKGEKNTGVDKNHHPTVKPLKLMAYIIALTTQTGDTVLDPFVGSGTTVIAAEQMGRCGIGIEREPDYACIAKSRLEALDADIR